MSAVLSAVSGVGVRLSGLTLGYDRHPAVHGLDGTIPAGDLLALVGPNGAGKSTLLKGLVGEVPALEGRVAHDAGRAGIAYLPQAAAIDRAFPLPVADLVGMGLWRGVGPWASWARHRARVTDALDAVGLDGFAARPIGTLSGGQFQRALFARLIVQDAGLILLDEPFSGIDARTVSDLLALIDLWHGQGRTVVAALHDLDQVRRHFPRTLLLAREPVAWGATRAVLTPENLARAGRLSEAWDEAAPVCGRGHAADHLHPGHDHAGHRHGPPPAATHDPADSRREEVA